MVMGNTDIDPNFFSHIRDITAASMVEQQCRAKMEAKRREDEERHQQWLREEQRLADEAVAGLRARIEEEARRGRREIKIVFSRLWPGEHHSYTYGSAAAQKVVAYCKAMEFGGQVGNLPRH